MIGTKVATTIEGIKERAMAIKPSEMISMTTDLNIIKDSRTERVVSNGVGAPLGWASGLKLRSGNDGL